MHKGNRLVITIPAVAQSAETDEADEDQNLNILQKIHDGEDLPTLSPVAIKIIKLASSENTSAAEIAKLISIDPALTARVLKITNSPFCWFSKKITSLSQAISLLDMKLSGRLPLELLSWIRLEILMAVTDSGTGIFGSVHLRRALLAI